MDKAENTSAKLTEDELRKVAGGNFIGGFGMTFEECTAVLKDAGDRAYACSDEYWGIHFSGLFSNVNHAEKAGTNEERLTYINYALGDLTSYPAIPNVTLTQTDYDFIHSRLIAVKAAIEIPPIHL